MSTRKKLISFLALLAVFAACGPPPRATLSQVYFAERAKRTGLHSALAATDLRNPDGSPRDERWLNYQPTGFNAEDAYAETIEEAESLALAKCNQGSGRNACYIHYSNANYVKFARREIWLQSNSSARRAIAAERNRAAEERRQNIESGTARLTSPPINIGPTAADYAEAEALFGIAQRAYESTFPRQPQRCTTTWNGMSWVTQCY